MSSSTLTADNKKVLDQFVEFSWKGLRSPVYRTPKEIEGWYIPAKDKNSNKLIICNHFMPGNRYGFAGHLPGLDSFGGFEVSFLPQYKALVDAGYNVLCYDLRNHGLSDSANGNTIGFGTLEWRDVIGSINYANSRSDTKNMIKSLLSICLGCNSTFFAMYHKPEAFKDIKCLVGVQPISFGNYIKKNAETMGMNVDEAIIYFNENLKSKNGLTLDNFETWEYAKFDKLPTKILQVKADTWTYPEDVEKIFDEIDSKEKELYWITGTDRRFDGYNFLGKNPEVAIEWFDKFMK
ncbi:hypothetical protein KGF54_003632 [Candida jiufengensis]|uniref:uncharacterized protein n=1 Tax=Candida jiufengensis TaxID=497108 RepID=UPI0022251A78|nr:uncharacterized protein KGF54_003632 [Candida jiufengensis]KAI5952765.1 hypothetical protein KGF54_003632 [Candida jiufengensis]